MKREEQIKHAQDYRATTLQSLRGAVLTAQDLAEKLAMPLGTVSSLLSREALSRDDDGMVVIDERAEEVLATVRSPMRVHRAASTRAERVDASSLAAVVANVRASLLDTARALEALQRRAEALAALAQNLKEVERGA